MPEWAVVEFDADQRGIWSAGPYDEDQARARFDEVVHGRSQRADVVLRTRAAALMRDGQVVEACSVRPSTRKPALGNKRLLSLDVDSREQIIGLELLGYELVHAATRRDGGPRQGPGWAEARAVACRLWDLVRGNEAERVARDRGGSTGAWWLVEWACGDHQVQRTQRALLKVCPYHQAERRRPPASFEQGW